MRTRPFAFFQIHTRRRTDASPSSVTERPVCGVPFTQPIGGDKSERLHLLVHDIDVKLRQLPVRINLDTRDAHGLLRSRFIARMMTSPAEDFFRSRKMRVGFVCAVSVGS